MVLNIEITTKILRQFKKKEYQGTLLTTTVLQQRKPEDKYKHEVWR